MAVTVSTVLSILNNNSKDYSKIKIEDNKISFTDSNNAENVLKFNDSGEVFYNNERIFDAVLLVMTATDALIVQIVMIARLAMIDVYKCVFLVITALVAIAVRLIVLVAMVAVLVVAIVAVLEVVQVVLAV